MKLKTLKKKIRKLEKRLREGPTKLAKLKRNLGLAEAKKKATLRPDPPARKSNAKTPAKPKGSLRQGAPRKVKRTVSLSPERRAELSAAMKARWAAKRAATAESVPPPAPFPADVPPQEASQPPAHRPDGT